MILLEFPFLELTALVWLKAIVGKTTPIACCKFSEEGMIANSGSVAYVIRCNLVKVLPRISSNFMEEI
jgi:hypothetical protein